jgi:taurine dioxygenase
MTMAVPFHLIPVSPTLGARIEGIDLSQPLSDTAVAALRQALLDHEVLFFENQELTPAQQRDFAARFGKLHVHPIRPSVPGMPEVLVLDNQPASETDNGNWRADTTFIETPPLGSILYAREVPPLGGDTIWSSLRAAYNGLSERLRDFLATLDAEHDLTRSFPPEAASSSFGIERYSWARREHPPVVHPVVRTHPETGRDSLFINPGFTTRILGVSPAESQKLLDLLNEHTQRPEYTVRWSWKPNSLAFWDNRVTQHYTVNDYQPNRRVMHRATILGDRPFNRFRQKQPENLAAE